MKESEAIIKLSEKEKRYTIAIESLDNLIEHDDEIDQIKDLNHYLKMRRKALHRGIKLWRLYEKFLDWIESN